MRITIVSHEHSDPDLIRDIRAVSEGSGHACTLAIARDTVALQGQHADLWIVDWPEHADAPPLPVRTNLDSVTGLTPLLAVIGRGRMNDALAAMTAGADDYIVRPLRRGELGLRTEALLQRAYPNHSAPDDPVQFGPYRFYTHRCQITRDSMPVEVTQKEFELAILFFQHLGRPLSRAFIQEEVWSREADLPSRTMDTHVSRIRNKLGLRPENGFRLVPVYSYGYKLEQLS
ncbi:response regulator transcription factor [Noviherbaspirillum sp. Root189]|uniref:response regulator transcription factor n=1 Tax=Noviherbaspirillum sp. Root189 TaxID=1736487 RepID=UPI000708FDD2|nr:response regulator transcription factor [Noviherbaspirillum sp. Root189]KRB92767.1 hypothetical protein ASE07_15510 [Noviherbaspirillum sp. Root189]